MNTEWQPFEDDHIIACHETGHLIAQRFRGTAIEKISLDMIEQKRGCFLKPDQDQKWSVFDEMLTLLAGPRAQFVMRPDSIDPSKIDAFRTRIIQPTETPYIIPDIYSHTGWAGDVKPVYEILIKPDWPVLEIDLNVTRSMVHDEVEKRLTAFFANQDAVEAVIKIAGEIAARRFLAGDEAEALVSSTGILESEPLRALMKWK